MSQADRISRQPGVEQVVPVEGCGLGGKEGLSRIRYTIHIIYLESGAHAAFIQETWQVALV